MRLGQVLCRALRGQRTRAHRLVLLVDHGPLHFPHESSHVGLVRADGCGKQMVERVAGTESPAVAPLCYGLGFEPVRAYTPITKDVVVDGLRGAWLRGEVRWRGGGEVR